MDALQRYAWPGNVRELENVVERAMIASSGDTLQLDAPLAFGPPSRAQAEASDNLDAVQRAHIESRPRAVRLADQRRGKRRGAPGHPSEHAAIPHEEAGRGVSRWQERGTSARRRGTVGLIAPVRCPFGRPLRRRRRWPARAGGESSFNWRYPGAPTRVAPLCSQPLKRFDARHVRGHEFRQIELKGHASAHAPSSSGTCATLSRPASRTTRRSVS